MHSHRAGDEYVAAIQGIGALPLLIPVTQPPLDPMALLARLDGLLFTGAPSNVAPPRYGGAPLTRHACWTKRAIPPAWRCCGRRLQRAFPVFASAAAFRN